MRRSSHKKAFLSSLILLLLCFAMLLGTTFAWFTKNVSTSVSTIQSGNLKVKLEYAASTKENGTLNWQPAPLDENGSVDIFGTNGQPLWEPGYTGIVYFRISNDGNLALQYNYQIRITENVTGTNSSNDTIDLTNYLKLKVEEDNRADQTKPMYGGNKKPSFAEGDPMMGAGLSSEGTGGKKGVVHSAMEQAKALNPGQSSNVIAVIVHMPTATSNAANPQSEESAPYLTLCFDVVATQRSFESDSIGNTYDQAATFPAYENDPTVATGTSEDE